MGCVAKIDARFGEVGVFSPPPRLAIKVFLLFRSLRLGAQQVLDAWDAWQTGEVKPLVLERAAVQYVSCGSIGNNVLIGDDMRPIHAERRKALFVQVVSVKPSRLRFTVANHALVAGCLCFRQDRQHR